MAVCFVNIYIIKISLIMTKTNTPKLSINFIKYLYFDMFPFLHNLRPRSSNYFLLLSTEHKTSMNYSSEKNILSDYFFNY